MIYDVEIVVTTTVQIEAENIHDLFDKAASMGYADHQIKNAYPAENSDSHINTLNT